VTRIGQTLKDLNIDQLYPPHDQALPSSQQPVDSEWTLDRPYYLKKLVKSIMLKFQELVGVLAADSSQFAEMTGDLTTLFYNAHSVINDYRQHQARETLMLMMEEQLEKKRAEVAEIDKMKEKINEILQGLTKKAPRVASPPQANGTASEQTVQVDKRKEEQKSMWQALDAEMIL
jgi:mediator of RNA polymerase II transcription subunit 7